MKLDIPFTLPTQRADGSTLSPSEISRIEFFVSVDGGQNYVSAGHAAPDQKVFQYDASDIATYNFRAEAVDLQVPERTSLDSNVVSYTVAPPVLAAPNAPVLGTPTPSTT